MQHRAPTQVRGRHRRTDALRGGQALTSPAPAPEADANRAYLDLLASPTAFQPDADTHTAEPTAATDAAQAYLDLLASSAPLTPADLLHHPAATATSPDLRAYRDLLASGDKLSPRPSAPAAEPTPHRRDVHSHRAPAKPIAPALLGERGRYAVAAAAIAAGVGVTGISAATTATPGRADAVAAAGAHSQAASHTELTPTPTPSTAATATPAATASTADTAVVDLYTAADGTQTAEPVPGTAAPVRGAVRAARKARPRPVPVVQWVDPMPGAATTSCFGPRWGRLHAGVDLAAPHGTPIVAAGAGTVVAAGPAAGYGIAVLIDHGNGYLTHYGHMSALTVTAGQQVKAGEQIGNEGSTGHSTGPHLHFEVHEGSYKNPIEPTAWMREHGVEIGGCGTN